MMQSMRMYFMEKVLDEQSKREQKKMSIEKITSSLESWMKWCRSEQMVTLMLNVSYMPDVSDEYRKGYVDALRAAESNLGLLMLEKGIDLRPTCENYESTINKEQDASCKHCGQRLYKHLDKGEKND